ncbi:MAG TPA: twin-arginine translocase TatA/TatE family subunit [Solirubrobacteraceae bacterium]|nr:twin-arginine translocase TatA/TatE family subunit [Solirubrobacteraceae bacterium]
MGLDNPLHIAIVLVVVLLVFGAKKLPEMGRGLGEGMRGFKSGLTGEPHVEEPKPQQLTPAPERPAAAATTSAEERTPERIA